MTAVAQSGPVRVSEKPILFSGPMVRAILENRKCMTRRVIKPQPNSIRNSVFHKSGFSDEHGYEIKPKYYPGDRLWVRETYANRHPYDLEEEHLTYRADYLDLDESLLKAGWGWKPSIFMPRTASRITLEITDVRVERIQDITEEDAKAEGAEKEFRVVVMNPTGCPDYKIPNSYRGGFANLWDRINRERGFGWDKNPWTWVVEFRKLANVDEG